MSERLELTIGRADTCDIRVTDEYASPRHAKLTIYADGRVAVEDLGSTNGTWIGTFRVWALTPIDRAGTLRVGRTTLWVADLLEAAARMRDGAQR